MTETNIRDTIIIILLIIIKFFCFFLIAISLANILFIKIKNYVFFYVLKKFILTNTHIYLSNNTISYYK
jgi:hypothetical protein